jgi:hypothetical protein
MFCTTRARAKLDDDGKWPYKLAIGVIQILLCIGAIGCAVSTLLIPVQIKSGTSDDARRTIIYIPAVSNERSQIRYSPNFSI